MAKFAIFVVSTPLQLLNAIEACSELELELGRAVLWVLVKNPEHWVTWRCAQSIECLPFTRVRLLELSRVSVVDGVFSVFKGLLANSAQIRSLASEHRMCTHFFLGNPKTREHLYLASMFSNARITILDDGTGTVSFLERVRARGGRAGGGLGIKAGVLPALKEVLFRIFYGSYRRPLLSADFYTAFVSQAEAAGFVARKNNYTWLVSRLQGKEARQGTHFLGAPFVERNELAWNNYRDWLETAMALLPGPVLYVAHWAESDAQLERIERELGLPCRRFDQPYELQYLVGDAAPACVASWFSSALDVLSLVPGTHARLLAFRVPVEAFRKADIAASALSFYERHGAGQHVVEIKALS